MLARGVSAMDAIATREAKLKRRPRAAVTAAARADVPPVRTTAEADAAAERLSKRAARLLRATARLSVPRRYTKRWRTRRETRRLSLVRKIVPLVSRTVLENETT